MAWELLQTILRRPLGVPVCWLARHRDWDWAKKAVGRSIAETEGKLARGSDPVLKARLGKFYLYEGDLKGAARVRGR